MAGGRYSRIDGSSSSSSSYCLSVTVMLFVVACVVGAWMTTSSSNGTIHAGISYEQFIGRMPKVSWGKSGSSDDALKGDPTPGNVQGDSNLNVQKNDDVPQKENQSSESDGDQKIQPKEIKEVEVAKDSNAQTTIGSISSDGDNDVGAQKSDDGEIKPDAEDQKFTTEKPKDGGLQRDESDQKFGREENADAKDQNAASDDSNNDVGPKKSDDGKDKSDTKDQNIISESSNDKYNNESDGQHGVKEGHEERKQVVVSEKKDEESKVYQDEIPPDFQNRDIDKSGQEQNSEESYDQTSDFKDSPQMSIASSPTQAATYEEEKGTQDVPFSKGQSAYRWKLCNVTAGPDYIPCLDNIQAIKKLKTTRHYEHRERHCPEEAPTCLVSLPKGYRTPIKWSRSRDMIWFANVPHTRLAEYKGRQNWVKVYGRYLTFPGGGTQFTFGALHYIDFIQQTLSDIAWGKKTRLVLDVGCGVASFGGYLFDRDVLTMSLAPKDEHEAQVQFALERGIPAISAVMGTKRLLFPSMAFDVVHCARCRVPWHLEGGKLLLELNRVLRPGGYFVWSATPVYRKDAENSGIWKAMSKLTKSMCWDLVTVGGDAVNRKKAAIFRKPTSNDCYEQRQENDPPLCEESDDPNLAWYTPLQSCMHKVPTDASKRGSQWPAHWPSRLENPPFWLKDSKGGVSDLPSSKEFVDDYNSWKQYIADIYINGTGVDWSSVRNVIDMNASYGGFAAALKDYELWVMNVVPVNSSDTLPLIFERGLFGMYHDWCESFSTYPRSYDLVHAHRVFSDIKNRCKVASVMAEVDRILRPGGWLIVRDDAKTIDEVKKMAKTLHWKIELAQSKDNEVLLSVKKTFWRPTEVETITPALG